ncbi:hypothetical protein F4680DRAFT_409871 [Xylaria scruposa]|nr:hypothetical protein F4680DRAFT_409871 [Xylaria scruposa]
MTRLNMRGLSPRLITGDISGDSAKIKTNLVPLSIGGINLIVEAVFLSVLTGLWTAMRFYCRRIKRVPLAIEDHIHFAALIFYYGQVITTLYSVLAGGAGHHVDELQSWHVVRFSQAIFAIQVLYALAVGLVKVSISVMLMRIFVRRSVRIAGIAILVLSVIWIFLTILVGLLLCRPIEKNWNPAVDGTCGNQYAGFGVVAGVDILNELSLVILPIPSVWRLQLSRRYKVALAGVFGAGVITLVVASLRIPILLETDFADLTFDTRSQSIALAEPAVAIIISCSPLLRPIFDQFLSKVLGTGYGNTSAQSHDLVNQAMSDRERSRVGGETYGYSKFGDSDDALELRNGNFDRAEQGLQTYITHGTTTHHPNEERGGMGITIMRETVITRDARTQ